jgi:hypothetical protein
MAQILCQAENAGTQFGFRPLVLEVHSPDTEADEAAGEVPEDRQAEDEKCSVFERLSLFYGHPSGLDWPG